MNPLRKRVALGLLLYAIAKAYDQIAKLFPASEYWALVYFGAAATVDWLMFHLCRRFLAGDLCSDIEALCTASIVANALGLALYLADSPPIPYPGSYVWMIEGINYVLAIRLIFMGGGDVFNYHHWRYLVRGFARGRLYFSTQKAKR